MNYEKQEWYLSQYEWHYNRRRRWNVRGASHWHALQARHYLLLLEPSFLIHKTMRRLMPKIAAAINSNNLLIKKLRHVVT